MSASEGKIVCVGEERRNCSAIPSGIRENCRLEKVISMLRVHERTKIYWTRRQRTGERQFWKRTRLGLPLAADDKGDYSETENTDGRSFGGGIRGSCECVTDSSSRLTDRSLGYAPLFLKDRQQPLSTNPCQRTLCDRANTEKSGGISCQLRIPIILLGAMAEFELS